MSDEQVCTCNASTTPHRHTHDGIVDVSEKERLETKPAKPAAEGKTRKIG